MVLSISAPALDEWRFCTTKRTTTELPNWRSQWITNGSPCQNAMQTSKEDRPISDAYVAQSEPHVQREKFSMAFCGWQSSLWQLNATILPQVSELYVGFYLNFHIQEHLYFAGFAYPMCSTAICIRFIVGEHFSLVALQMCITAICIQTPGLHRSSFLAPSSSPSWIISSFWICSWYQMQFSCFHEASGLNRSVLCTPSALSCFIAVVGR